jgi:hypothetical protein
MTNINNLTNNEITKFLASKSEDQILQELSAGSGFDMENPFIEDMFTDDSNDEPTTEDVVEEVLEEKPKKRKRRTKAQIEADKLKEEQAKQEENNELEDLDEDILDQTEDYIVDLNVLEPTKKEKVEKTKVVDNFFDDDFDFTTTKEKETKEPTISVDDLDDDFDFLGNDTPKTTEVTKPKKTVQDLVDNELSDIVIDVTAKEVTKPKPDKFERLREEEQKFKDAKLQNAIKQQNIIKEEASVERPKKAGVFGESMSEAEIEAMLNEQDKKATTPTQQTPKLSNRTGKIPPKPTQPTKTVTKETKTDEIITTDERLEIKNKIKQIVKEELREQLLRKIVQEELQKMDLQDLIREEFNNIYNN